MTKKLKIVFDDDVFKKLESAVIGKQMVGGLCGIADEVLHMIVISMRKGDKQLVVSLKRQKKRR